MKMDGGWESLRRSKDGMERRSSGTQARFFFSVLIKIECSRSLSAIFPNQL